MVLGIANLPGGRHWPYAASFILYTDVLSPWQHHYNFDKVLYKNIMTLSHYDITHDDIINDLIMTSPMTSYDITHDLIMTSQGKRNKR